MRFTHPICLRPEGLAYDMSTVAVDGKAVRYVAFLRAVQASGIFFIAERVCQSMINAPRIRSAIALSCHYCNAV